MTCTKFFLQLTLSNITVWSSRASKPVSSSKIFFRVILGWPTLRRFPQQNSASSLIVSWHLTSQTKSFSSNDLSDTRVRAVGKIVSDFVFSRHILYFPQHYVYTCHRAFSPEILSVTMSRTHGEGCTRLCDIIGDNHTLERALRLPQAFPILVSMSWEVSV